MSGADEGTEVVKEKGKEVIRMRTKRGVSRSILFLLTFTFTMSVSTHAQDENEELRRRAKNYEPVMAEMARRNGIDSRLLWTIAYLESRFRPQLVSPKGARGMMQFMPATAARYNLANPHDAVQSIEAAAHYLRDLSLKFGNRLDLILAAYNAGEGAVESYRSGARLILGTGKVINPAGVITGGIPPYRETRGYVAQGIIIFNSLKQPAGLKYVRLPESVELIRQDEDEEELNEIREDTLYPASESGRGVGDQIQVKPMQQESGKEESKVTDSIYVN